MLVQPFLPFSLLCMYIQLSVLQSCMALLFLIATRCNDITVEVCLLTQKLSSKSFLLFISLCYPMRLHALLFAAHLKQSTAIGLQPLPQLMVSPSSKLPKIDSLSITTDSLSPVKSFSPLRGQNKSLSLKRKLTTKGQGGQFHVMPARKRVCENCNSGAVMCYRCQLSMWEHSLQHESWHWTFSTLLMTSLWAFCTVHSEWVCVWMYMCMLAVITYQLSSSVSNCKRSTV